MDDGTDLGGHGIEQEKHLTECVTGDNMLCLHNAKCALVHTQHTDTLLKMCAERTYTLAWKCARYCDTLAKKCANTDVVLKWGVRRRHC